MELRFFSNLKKDDKINAVEKLVKNSSPSQQFFLMVILSVLMASLGIIQNNTAVIIGSMLIAPVLYPVLGISMGLVMSGPDLVSRSLMTLIKSIGLAVVASFLASIFFLSIPFNVYISIDFIEPSLISAAIAVIAGLAASFSLVKPEMSETLPGVAISVSLVPPLAAIGVGLSNGSWSIVLSSFLLFVVNVFGIIFASMLVFSLMNFYVNRRVVATEIKKEDRIIETDKIIEAEEK